MRYHPEQTRLMNKLIMVFAALVPFGPFEAIGGADLSFEKEIYVFSGLSNKETNIVKAVLLNTSNHKIDQVRVNSSCGCLSVLKESIPGAMPPNGKVEIFFKVRNPTSIAASKTNTVFATYDGGTADARIITSFVLSEGFYPTYDIYFYCGVLDAHEKTRSVKRTIRYKMADESLSEHQLSLELVEGIDEVEVIIRPLGIISPGLHQWEIEVKPRMTSITGEFDAAFVLAVNGDDTKRISCRVFGRRKTEI